MSKSTDLGALRLADLHALVSLRRAGSATKAARAAGVPTSQVTRAVRRLEEMLGERLVEQRAGTLALTEAGTLRAGHFADFLDQLRGSPGPVARELTVFAPSYLLPAVQRVLAHVCPGVLVRLVEGTQMLATSLMTSGVVDLSLLFDPGSAPKSFAVSSLGMLDHKLHVRRTMAKKIGKRVTSEDAAQLAYVAPMHRTDRGMEAGDDRCPLPLRKRRVAVWVSTVVAAMRVASQNEYAVFGPTVAATEFGRDLCAVDVPGWSVRSELFVAAHMDRIYAKELAALCKGLQAIIRG